MEQAKSTNGTSGLASGYMNQVPIKAEKHAVSGFVVSGTPQMDMEDLFKHCDLPTRCRLRRVSRYWKHLLSLNEVNKVVVVNRSSVYVTNPSSKQYGGVLRFGDRLRCGWHDISWSEAKTVNLPDHKRNGLLGAHVRTIIYDGGHKKEPVNYDNNSAVRTIRSIGMYCTGVQHIVLWRLGQNGIHCGLYRKQDFRMVSPSAMPTPKFLTVVASKFVVAYVKLMEVGLRDDYHVTANIRFWSDLDQSNEEFIKQFVCCSSAQRLWLARQAPNLPEKFHKWAEAGAHIVRLDKGKYTEIQLKTDLRDGDYDCLDPCFLQALAFCVRRRFGRQNSKKEQEA